MKIKSMTGFGSAERVIDSVLLSIEISAVNRRSLELHIGMPREWQAAERLLAKRCKERIGRGKVSIGIRCERQKADGEFDCDDSALRGAYQHLKDLSESLGCPFNPDANLLLSLVRSMGSGAGLPGLDAVESLLTEAMDEALENFIQSRSKEGAALAEDLKMRLEHLAALTIQMRAAAEGTVENHRAVLLERLERLGLELDLEDERLLKELAIFADKSDVNEELTRLASHFEQFSGLFLQEERVGRTMDFLCQEIHRELNTIGSKAAVIELTRLVIEGKNTLECIREQVQNIE